MIRNSKQWAIYKKIEEIVSTVRNNRLNVGELDIDETEETLTNPNSRVIKQITVEDVKKADKMFEDLMGTAVVPRKEFIKRYSQDATCEV